MRQISMEISDKAAQKFDEFCVKHRVPSPSGKGMVRISQSDGLTKILEGLDGD